MKDAFKKTMDRLRRGKFKECYTVTTSRGYIINVYKVEEDRFEIAWKDSFQLTYLSTIRLLRQPPDVIRMVVQKLQGSGFVEDKKYFDTVAFVMRLYKQMGVSHEDA